MGKNLSMFDKELNSEYQVPPIERSSKIENNNKNNSNGNDEMMNNQMILSKLTRQIQEFQWIYLRDKCLLEILRIKVPRLQELYVKCVKIYRWVFERRALIEKMIEFEKRAHVLLSKFIPTIGRRK
ncbi:hypothetical protein Glove_50g37 [Diversispora epigaea]|uniref:Uncharacterized protein n=1 Tax=Diversispora epigaea TaxID=1348612 RepID=A0A397JGY4_9GLOM|nr:hypothetical protein Glove_50g37 [Diversispora epigaea]